MRTVLTLLSISLLLACGTSESQKTGTPTHTDLPPLNLDQETKAFFTDGEVQSLREIVNFFEEGICNRPGSGSTLDACYEHFFAEVDAMVHEGNIDLPFTRESLKSLHTELEKQGDDAIWDLQHAKDDDKAELRLIQNGHYTRFLQDLGKNYPAIAQYAERWDTTGGISPTLYVLAMNQTRQLKPADPRIRIFFAVHYLMIADTRTRNLYQERPAPPKRDAPKQPD